MKRSGFYEVETLFDAFDARIQPIHTPVDAGEPFFNVRQTYFDIVQIVTEAIHAFLNPRQTRLDLLQNRNNKIGNFAHDGKVSVLPMFCKLERAK